MQEVFDFIKKCGTYYLATVDGDQARVRPFGTVNLFDGKLYIQTGKIKDCAKQMIANPKVELCCFDGPSGTWLRLAGTAVLDDRVEPQESMLEEYPNLRAMYTPGDGNTAVFYLKDARATFASFTAPARTVEF